ncbi:MAG: FAD-dependent oxidoreductase, partial [Flavitalea sp.]
MPEKRSIAVIGAGPAGLTAAYCLVKKGFDVDVYEADSQVGGMCKTIELWGCKVDIGPHRFFSSDRQVNELWLEVAGKDYEMISRLTRIYYKSRFFLYPLKPLNAFVNLGPIETIRCLLSYSKQILRPTPVKNDFESWVTSRYGKRLFSIFFKNYSEKLWGLPCTNLDSDFATQRIKKLSLYEAVKNAFFGGGGHKTLVDEFAYPREGTGMIYNRMAEKITAGGGSIHLKTPIKKILVKDHIAHGVETFSGEQIQYDEVISTMPLTLMVTQLDDVPAFIRDNI